MLIQQALAVFGLAIIAWSGRAEVFDLPEDDNSLIGKVVFTAAAEEDTLLDIARQHSLGYRDIQLANPHLDMWLPGQDMEVMLPKKYVLPMAPRTGIVLNIPEMRLYYYPPAASGRPAKVYTYPLGIGREGWSTPYVSTSVIQKQEDPYWHPPESIRKEYEEKGEPLPVRVPPGDENPLGKYAMRLGIPAYLIHGTNKPYGIGMRVSHGCIRLYPEDIEALYRKVGLGTPVRIVNQPYKLGLSDNRFYLEAHPYLEEDSEQFRENLTSVVKMLVKLTEDRDYEIDWELAKEVIKEARGIPVEIGRLLPVPLMAERGENGSADDHIQGVELKLETDLKEIN
ncbi:MAG: L,D-transpeptidase family protein [Gammaproteobacteria bacterium]